MAKLFGCPINLEAEDEVNDGIIRSRNQPGGEATSFSAGLPPFNQRETNIPYFRFLDSNSDSESESDLHSCFIDFFDRDSYIASNQRLSSTSCYFDIWGTQDMDEETELGLRIGSGSGSGDSVGLGLQVSEIDSGRVQIDTGRVVSGFTPGAMIVDDSEPVEATGRVEIDTVRVEVDTSRVVSGFPLGAMIVDDSEPVEATDRVGVDAGRVEIDTGRVEVDTSRVVSGFTLGAMIVDEEPVEANLLPQEEVEGFSWLDDNQEDEPMDQEWDDGFSFEVHFEQSIETTVGADSFWDSFLDSVEFAENHRDDEDVLERTFQESGINGSPPASKSVVDELPDVGIITSEELSISCAICKDEIVVEEKVKRLPCKHYYHGDCIVPWLGIRNTCPVCRYELPTDDLEYERNRRSQRRRLV